MRDTFELDQPHKQKVKCKQQERFQAIGKIKEM